MRQTAAGCTARRKSIVCVGCVQPTHVLFYGDTRPFTGTHFLQDPLVTNKPPVQFSTSTQSQGALNVHLPWP